MTVSVRSLHCPICALPCLRAAELTTDEVTVPPTIQRYGFALASSACALLLTVICAPVMTRTPFLFFFAAVGLSAWYGGFRAGLLATVAAIVLVDSVLFIPRYAISLDRDGLLVISAFAGVALLLSVLADQQRRVAAEAIAARQRFAVTLGSIADAVIVTDPAQRITFLNHAAEHVTGWPAVDALGRGLAEVVPLVPAGSNTALDEGPPALGPVSLDGGLDRAAVLVARDGTHRALEVRATSLEATPGMPGGTVVVLRDVSERNRIATEVRQSRDQLAIILRAVADGITVQAPTGALLYANDRAAQSMGFPSAAALLATPVAEIREHFEIMDEAGQPFPLDRLPGRLALQGHHVPEVLVRFRVRATGEERWSLLTATPVVTAAGAVAAAVNVWHDVTERQRARQVERFLAEAGRILAASLDYETTLDQIAHLVVPTLADWCVIDLVGGDGEVQRLVTRHRDPAKQALVAELRRRYPASADAPHGPAKVLRTGQADLLAEIPEPLIQAEATDAEHARLLHALGLTSLLCVPLLVQRQVRGTLTLAMAESGRHFSVADLAVAEEVAQRAALALEHARLYDEAQTAIRVRDEFVSIAAHELKTPVTAMLGYAETMLRRATKQRPYTLTDRDERALQVIVSQTHRLRRLIDTLLSVGRVQQGRFNAVRQPMDLSALVQQIVAELSILLERHTLELHCSAAEMRIDGDRALLEQVLHNLLQNAVKYSPAGGRIWVTVAQEADQVCLAVTDEGFGMSRAAQAHLFEPFYRAPTTAVAAIGGTGLGLYIVKEIVALHHGVVEVDSREGQGSTFRIRLPLLDHHRQSDRLTREPVPPPRR